MATPILVAGQTIYLPTDLQKTESDANKSAAFSDFIKKTVKGLDPAKTYNIQFKWVFQDGTKSRDWSPSYRIQMPSDPPKIPTGFTAVGRFASVSVTWTGAYQGAEPGKSFAGFKQINVYAGTSATYSPTTSKLAGILYTDLTNNTINIPVDGTYVRYGLPVYIHASSLNNKVPSEESDKDLVATVTDGALKASDVDLGPGSVTISKLKGDVLVFDNITAGNLSATSFFRAGDPTYINKVGKVETANGARIEISSSTTNITSYPDPLDPNGAPITLTNPVLPGFTIYNTSNTPIFRATLNGQLTVGGYQPAGNYIGPGDVNANVTNISGNAIKTGIIYSNGYIFANTSPQDLTTADGSGFSYLGTAINLINGSITSKNFRIDIDGNVEFKGLITTNGMALGKKADGTNDGIYLGPNDYWYANKTFSFAGGSLTGNSSSVTFNTGNITFSNTGSFQSDENNYAGDPTITLSDQSKLTLGRRLIYNVTSVPQNPVDGAPGGSAANTWNSLTQTGTFNWKNSGTAKPVKAGDLLFTT